MAGYWRTFSETVRLTYNKAYKLKLTEGGATPPPSVSCSFFRRRLIAAGAIDMWAMTLLTPPGGVVLLSARMLWYRLCLTVEDAAFFKTDESAFKEALKLSRKLQVGAVCISKIAVWTTSALSESFDRMLAGIRIIKRSICGWGSHLLRQSLRDTILGPDVRAKEKKGPSIQSKTKQRTHLRLPLSMLTDSEMTQHSLLKRSLK